MWREVPESRRKAGFSGWDLILILDLAVIGLGGILTVLAGPAVESQAMSPAMRRLEAWLNVGFGFLLLAILPVVWLLLTRAKPVEGTLRFLRMRVESAHRWPYWVGLGCFLAVGFYVAVVGVFSLLHWLEVAPGGDPYFEELARVGNWPLMIAIAVGAGVGEEIFFRGLLQRWLGWIGQALVFGVLHINQGFIAIAFITVLALVFGWILKRGAPLWALMIAHTGYDLLVLGQSHIGAQA